jgi:hypothetical protein
MCESSMGRAILGVATAMALAACAGSTERLSSGGAGGVGGAAGAGGSHEPRDGAAGEGFVDAAADAANGGRPPDFERLETCAAAKPCLDSGAQLVEGGRGHLDVGPLTCLFESLRDRIRGKYVHHTRDTFGNGDIGAHHLVLLANDGHVKYARDRYSYIWLSADGSSYRAPDRYGGVEPGERCQLKPPSYFDECIQALKSPASSEAWTCAFGDGTASVPSTLFWFESCVEESPLACEDRP